MLLRVDHCKMEKFEGQKNRIHPWSWATRGYLDVCFVSVTFCLYNCEHWRVFRFNEASDDFLVVVPVADDGPAGRLHLSAQPASKAAHTSQQLAHIHFPWPKEEQKLPRVKSECCFQLIQLLIFSKNLFNLRDQENPKYRNRNVFVYYLSIF